MIKNILLLLTLTSFTYANVNAVVSILPQKTFVEAIGGDKVNVSLMVKPGNSPHSYEPKPSQMRDIAKADIYFTMDVEFENVWLEKFKNQNKTMEIADLAHGIKKSKMEKHSHDHHEEHEEEKHHDHDEHKGDDDHDDHKKHEENEEHHEDEGLDPHVWTSPSNVKIIAKNILDELVHNDVKNKSYYISNYNNFIATIDETDTKIKKLLKDSHNAKFMVFHPAWGYFASQYHLEQVAVEVSGKSPKPKQVQHLIEEAKKDNIKAIFTSPEFSDSISKQIANELNIKVIKVSPLNPKWSQNLINLAKAISGR